MSVSDTPLILAEEPDLWVVEKPAGWLTIPPREESRSPVLNQWLEEKVGAPVWVVHRIDRETSGVLLFARNADAHRQLNEVFQNHLAKKIYECLAEGVMERPALRLDAPIEGKRSLSQVEKIEQFAGAFHARVRIETGRQHQIRIHLSDAGHPLLGDRRYGGNSGGVGVDRVALHAASLRLPDGREWKASLPADMRAWIQALKEGPK